MKTQLLCGEDYYTIAVDSRGGSFFHDLHLWLNDNCVGDWVTMARLVGFKKEADAMFFKLAWKG